MSVLTKKEIEIELGKLPVGWALTLEGHLAQTYPFPDFLSALNFANKIAPLAEEAGHHPDFYISWGKCHVELWTHDENGLTKKDFQLTKKIGALK